MRLHIVTEAEAQRWVLLPVAENLAHEIPGTTIGTSPDSRAAANLFINYALYEPVRTVATALFTHRERAGPFRARFNEVARRVNYCFGMNRHTLALLPKEKSSILWVWPDVQFYRKTKIVLGISGRSYKSGRKRMEWIKDLRAIPGVEVRTTDSKLPWKHMPRFYDGLDYLVVIADNEGGPVTVLEALARGVPVIAPNVGYCWEFSVLRYRTKDELLNIVEGLVIPRDGWAQTAKHVMKVHRRLLG